MLQVQKFTFNPFQENTYVLFDETKTCAIIDPGCYQRHEQEELRNYIEINGLQPARLLNTHGHIDHAMGNKFVAETFKLDVEIHEADVPTLESITRVAELYDIPNVSESPKAKRFLNEGDQIHIGNSILDVLFVPGHAPGHVVFVNHEDKYVINGDCLFQGSIGRTDLPGGDHDTLLNAIQEKLFTLPPDYLVYTGHGPETTIGHEKTTNPFFKHSY